jgi:hypothetical protein
LGSHFVFFFGCGALFFKEKEEEEKHFSALNGWRLGGIVNLSLVSRLLVLPAIGGPLKPFPGGGTLLIERRREENNQSQLVG